MSKSSLRLLAGFLAAGLSIAGPGLVAQAADAPTTSIPNASAQAPWFQDIDLSVQSTLGFYPLTLTSACLPFWQYADGFQWAQYNQWRLAQSGDLPIYTLNDAPPLPNLPAAPAGAPAWAPTAPTPAPAPAGGSAQTQTPASQSAAAPGTAAPAPSQAASSPQQVVQTGWGPMVIQTGAGQYGNWLQADTPATGWGDVAGQQAAQAQQVAPAPTQSAPAQQAAPAQPAPAPSAQAGLTAEEQHMVDLVNNARAQAGLAPLTVDPRLQQTATAKSQDMINLNYFDHNSPDLGSPFDQMQRAGISYSTAGENIAGNQSVDAAFTALMNSPGHRANILNPSFTKIGIGIVHGGRYGLMVTQQFIG